MPGAPVAPSFMEIAPTDADADEAALRHGCLNLLGQPGRFVGLEACKA